MAAVDSHDNDGTGALDPLAGVTYLTKPVWDTSVITANAKRTGWDWYTNNYGELEDGRLDYGFWLTFEELADSYYVNVAGTAALKEALNPNAFAPFTAGQIAAARSSVALWDDLIVISFRESGAAAADITYAGASADGAQGYAYLPFGSIYDDEHRDQSGFEEFGRIGGDVWIDGSVASNLAPLADSYYARLTMIHETGHALGLSHPGDYDALDDDDGDGEPDAISFANDAAFSQDSLQYSVMSYFDAFETGAQHIDWSLLNLAFASTPLVHDIAAIQAIYGADLTTRSGNTVYGFNATAAADVYDFAVNTRPVLSIWDAGGTDTLDFSGWNTDSVIDLNPGAFSSGGGVEAFLTLDQVNANRAALGLALRTEAAADYFQAVRDQFQLSTGVFRDNVSIAYGATIENAVGGGGDDRIVGNAANNVLTGNGGADLFELRTAAVSGVDRITDFGRADVLAVTKAIADSNGDGLITWNARRALMLDTDGDAVTLTGPAPAKGIRSLGTLDGMSYYGDTAVRPAQTSAQRVWESQVGDDVLAGSTSTSRVDVFFFDTANASPGQGSDSINFSAKDLLVTTTALEGMDGSGHIGLSEGTLHLSGNGGLVEVRRGSLVVNALEFDGAVAHGGVTYYVYSTVGSGVGTWTLDF